MEYIDLQSPFQTTLSKNSFTLYQIRQPKLPLSLEDTLWDTSDPVWCIGLYPRESVHFRMYKNWETIPAAEGFADTLSAMSLSKLEKGEKIV